MLDAGACAVMTLGSHRAAIKPFAYLADVITRVQDHPKRRLDELLPGPWALARTKE
jgi:hypothetical protein